MPVLAISNLVKTYAHENVSSVVLQNISFTVNAGEMLAIVGASGSGKSTLMNIIGLLDKADSGSYLLQGRNVASLSDDEQAVIRNLSMGFVFQQFNLLSRLSVAQNVALPLVYRGSSLIEKRVLRALIKVGMQDYMTYRPTQLSGGQQQRVAIARALVGEPDVILADEPTGALDSATGREIMRLFLDLRAEGRTLLLVTHDEQVAAQCARRIVLADGKIILDTLQ